MNERQKQQILDVLGKVITEYVRDKSIDDVRKTVDGTYANSDQRIRKDFNKLDAYGKDFCVNQALPYIVDSVIYHFLSMFTCLDTNRIHLFTTGTGRISLETGEMAEADVSVDNSVRFSLDVQLGNETPFSVTDIASPTLESEPFHFPSLNDYGWSQRFSEFPSSSYFEGEDEEEDTEQGNS